MSDRRYRTSAWQRLRKAVLQRDGYECRIRGPRCTGAASTVHHILPSSQYPDLFFSPDNLAASCARCNYSGGGQIGADNRRRRVEQLEQIVAAQDQRIQELVDQLIELQEQHPKPAARPEPQVPAIY